MSRATSSFLLLFRAFYYLNIRTKPAACKKTVDLPMPLPVHCVQGIFNGNLIVLTHSVSLCMTPSVCLWQVTLRMSCWTRFLRRRWKWRGRFVEMSCARHARMKKVRQTRRICVYRQFGDSSSVIQGVVWVYVNNSHE